MCLVSIIVPNFNHAPFLGERLNSIFNQTFVDYELIILDDASTDNSDEVIKRLIFDKSKTIYIPNKLNSGSTFSQWNKGILLAKGKYIWIAESDDYSDKDFLAQLVPCLENNLDVSLVYCQSNLINDGVVTGNLLSWTNDLSDTLWCNNFKLNGKDAVLNYWIHKNILMNASSAIFRKDIYLAYAKNNDTFKLCGDWYTWISMMRGHNLYFCSIPLNFYRRHENTVTSNLGRKILVKKEINKIHQMCLKYFCKSENDIKTLKRAHYINWASFITFYGKKKYLSQFIQSFSVLKQPNLKWTLEFLLKFLKEKFYSNV